LRASQNSSSSETLVRCRAMVSERLLWARAIRPRASA
jgi:hypothetical protein